MKIMEMAHIVFCCPQLHSTVLAIYLAYQIDRPIECRNNAKSIQSLTYRSLNIDVYLLPSTEARCFSDLVFAFSIISQNSEYRKIELITPL